MVKDIRTEEVRGQVKKVGYDIHSSPLMVAPRPPCVFVGPLCFANVLMWDS